MQKHASTPGPIFIVGMNGSGTTMLLDHLNSHSQIYGFGDETRILPHYLQNEKTPGAMASRQQQERLWLELCKSFPFWKANGEQPVPLPDNWRELGDTAAEIFDYILSYFAEGAGKEIWCEKTPMHALHIASLGAAFPAARFVHIIRDGRDCAASFERRWGYNAQVTIFRWKKTIRNARQQAREVGPKRYKEVRFEELTQRPESTLREICWFLELPFQNDMLTTKRSTKRVRGIESKKMTPNSGSFQKEFTPAQIARLENIAGSLLHELGYSAEDTLGDRDLGRIYVWIRQTTTQVRRIRDILDRARSAKKPMQIDGFQNSNRSGIPEIQPILTYSSQTDLSRISLSGDSFPEMISNILPVCLFNDE